MKEKKSILERIASGKGFYITVALSLIVIVTAIAFVYNSSMNMLSDIDIPTTLKQVEKNQTSVIDPRNDDINDDYYDLEEFDEEDDDEYTAEEDNNITSPQKSTTEKSTTIPESITITEPVEVFSNDTFIMPLSGEIDRRFSMSPVYDETMEDWRIHKGVDFLCQQGDEVKSIGNGKVVKVISDPSWGYCIDVDYGKFIARYCGLQQGTTVIIDDTVSKGDIIGKVSTSPCESKQESHLHFEIVRDGVWIDPASVIGN